MEAAGTAEGRVVLESELCQQLTAHVARLWDVVCQQQQHAEVIRVCVIVVLAHLFIRHVL